jgi:hypothetical protein
MPKASKIEDWDLDVKTGENAVDYALNNGGRVVRQNGTSHCIVGGPFGRVPVPVGHSKELPKGTKSAIKRQYRSIGIPVPVVLLGLSLVASVGYLLYNLG